MTRLLRTLVVFHWKLGDQEPDSGVRGDEPETYPAWINAVNAVGAQGGEQA